MDLDPVAAVLAGLGAGVVMIAARIALRAAGAHLEMDVTRMWRAMFGVRGGAGRVFGLGVHFAVSAVVGLVYAIGLRMLFNASEALLLWGVLGGVIHYTIAGLFLAIAPEIVDDVPARVPAPGLYATRLGAGDVVGFLVGHLAYGGSFGILYALLHSSGGATNAL